MCVLTSYKLNREKLRNESTPPCSAVMWKTDILNSFSSLAENCCYLCKIIFEHKTRSHAFMWMVQLVWLYEDNLNCTYNSVYAQRKHAATDDYVGRLRKNREGVTQIHTVFTAESARRKATSTYLCITVSFWICCHIIPSQPAIFL